MWPFAGRVVVPETVFTVTLREGESAEVTIQGREGGRRVYLRAAAAEGA